MQPRQSRIPIDDGETPFMALFACWSRVAGAICQPLSSTPRGDDLETIQCLDLIVLAAPRDAEQAFHIHKELSKMGFRAVIECEKVTGKLTAEQQATLHRARMVLFLISPATAASYFCSQELAFILETKKPLVPLYLCPPERIQLTPDLSRRFSAFPQFLLFENYHDCQARLIAYLAVTLYGRRRSVDPEMAAGGDEAGAVAVSVGAAGEATPAAPVKVEKPKLHTGEIRRLRLSGGQPAPTEPLNPPHGHVAVTPIPGTPIPGTPHATSPHATFAAPPAQPPPLLQPPAPLLRPPAQQEQYESPTRAAATAILAQAAEAAASQLQAEGGAAGRPTFQSMYLGESPQQPHALYPDPASFPAID